MNIRLPEFYDRDYAYVKDNVLFVNETVRYDKLMYDVTYELKGRKRCLYCGKRLNPSNRTMDHMYPRRWGGISIPDNLIPCCSECNQMKKDMTYKQFMYWASLRKKSERSEFYQSCVQKNIQVAKMGIFIIKSKWLTDYDTSELLENISFDDEIIESSKMEKLTNYYKNWNQYPHPLIVSSNGFVFKGLHILCHAKSISQPIVKAIVLENVLKN